jgi:hypothetical protein
MGSKDGGAAGGGGLIKLKPKTLPDTGIQDDVDEIFKSYNDLYAKCCVPNNELCDCYKALMDEVAKILPADKKKELQEDPKKLIPFAIAMCKEKNVMVVPSISPGGDISAKFTPEDVPADVKPVKEAMEKMISKAGEMSGKVGEIQTSATDIADKAAAVDTNALGETAKTKYTNPMELAKAMKALTGNLKSVADLPGDVKNVVANIKTITDGLTGGGGAQA